MRTPKIWIDAGHGNNDPGALAVDGRRRESDDNLRLALLIDERLKRAGYETRMTRTANNFTNNGRSTAANSWNADAYISIHRNSAQVHRNGIAQKNPDGSAMLDTTAHGFETFTKTNFTAADELLAQRVHSAVVKAGVQRDRGVKRHNFGSLVDARMPAILVEFGFMPNTRDNQLFDQNINAYADAVVSAICSIYPVTSIPAPQPAPAPPAPSTKTTTLHRVVIGSFSVRNNAEAQLQQARQNGFPDAFIQTVQV
jgi:N-acetylmuramoyl-L-alanine amidase